MMNEQQWTMMDEQWIIVKKYMNKTKLTTNEQWTTNNWQMNDKWTKRQQPE